MHRRHSESNHYVQCLICVVDRDHQNLTVLVVSRYITHVRLEHALLGFNYFKNNDIGMDVNP